MPILKGHSALQIHRTHHSLIAIKPVYRDLFKRALCCPNTLKRRNCFGFFFPLPCSLSRRDLVQIAHLLQRQISKMASSSQEVDFCCTLPHRLWNEIIRTNSAAEMFFISGRGGRGGSFSSTYTVERLAQRWSLVPSGCHPGSFLYWSVTFSLSVARFKLITYRSLLFDTFLYLEKRRGSCLCCM